MANDAEFGGGGVAVVDPGKFGALQQPRARYPKNILEVNPAPD